MFLNTTFTKMRIIGILFFILISNIGNSQTNRDNIFESSEYINKNKYLNIAIQESYRRGAILYFPIYINFNNKIEKIIVDSYDLRTFYTKKLKVSYLDWKLQEEYQILVKNLILNKDTLEIDSSFFVDEFNKEITIYKVPLDHYIYHFPDSAKKQIIESYFDVDGEFIEDSIDAFAPLINKMAEWYFFIERFYPFEGETICLFNYLRYYETNNLDELIHKSLKLFIEQNELIRPVNIEEWTFPNNILISLSKIGIEGKKIGFIQAKDTKINNVKAISLDGIVINDNIITIILLYSNYDYSKEKENMIKWRLIETKFSYKYIEEEQIWKLIDQSQENFKY